MSEIRQEDLGSGGSFFFAEDGKDLGELHYRKSSKDVVIIDHTEVDPSMEGKGVGKKLLEHVVSYLRENHLKVIPTCTYANATFKKHPEWQDLLYK